VKANFYARVKAEKGRDPPPEFLNPPSVHRHLIFYSDAFWRLHHDRPVTMAVGRIPWVAMKAYADQYGVTGDHFDRFVTLIVAQDTEYLSVTNRRDSDTGTPVDLNDAEAVSSMFARLEKRLEDTDDGDLDLEPED
jgi:hypothetical protein